MKKTNKNIIIKGNSKLDAKLTALEKRKQMIKELIQKGASPKELRKVAPLS